MEPADEENVVRLVEMEDSQGGIEEDEAQMIRAVFELEDMPVRDVMVPRIDIVAVDTSCSVQQVASVISERGFSRIPLYDGSIDNVVGVVYAKDLFRALRRNEDLLAARTLEVEPHKDNHLPSSILVCGLGEFNLRAGHIEHEIFPFVEGC